MANNQRRAEARRDIDDLQARSRELRAVLQERATGIWDALPGVEDAFYEGCYCLCAVQNPAVRTVAAVQWMRDMDIYDRLTAPSEVGETVKMIATGIRGLVRFHNVKSGRIALFRGQIAGLYARLASAGEGEAPALRDRLIHEVKGFGFKEASHFLRNVGFRGLTIPDVHILRRLTSMGLLAWDGGSPSARTYHKADAAMRRYADSIGADLDELDALWWSQGSGKFGR